MRLTAIWSMTILAFATGAWENDYWTSICLAYLETGSFKD